MMIGVSHPDRRPAGSPQRPKRTFRNLRYYRITGELLGESLALKRPPARQNSQKAHFSRYTVARGPAPVQPRQDTTFRRKQLQIYYNFLMLSWQDFMEDQTRRIPYTKSFYEAESAGTGASEPRPRFKSNQFNTTFYLISNPWRPANLANKPPSSSRGQICLSGVSHGLWRAGKLP